MKLALFILLLLFSIPSIASLCSVENSRLAWDDDTVSTQYECQNEKLKLCASRATLLGDGVEYFVLAGSLVKDSFEMYIKSFILLPALGNEKFFENDLLLSMQQSPDVPFTAGAKKRKTSFSLDKTTGVALFKVESRDLISTDPWVKQVSEKLHCQKLSK